MFTFPYQCRVISPMSLCGADNRTPEFRSQSIKGLMRFWWRASQQATDLRSMRSVEGELFGTDAKDDGQGGRSPFRIRVSCDDELRDFRDLCPGSNKAKAQCFIPPCRFKVNFDARLKKDLDRGKTIFELSALLGGLGKRVRRGFGSFTIDDSTESTSTSGHDAEDNLRKRILDHLKSIAQSGYQLDKEVIKPRTPPAGFSYPNIMQIHVKAATKNADEICHHIHQVSHYFSTNRGSTLVDIDPKQRHSSPVCVSLYQTANNNLFVIITLLNSQSGANGKRALQEKFIDQVKKNV